MSPGKQKKTDKVKITLTTIAWDNTSFPGRVNLSAFVCFVCNHRFNTQHFLYFAQVTVFLTHHTTSSLL